MITVRKFIRTAGVLLLTVLLFNSCTSKKVEDFPYVSLDTIDTAVKACEYRIIIPATASAELTAAAEALRDGLRSKKPLPVEIYLDSDELYYKMNIWDIYVGNTGSEYSRQALRNMRSEDYTCRSYNGYSIIGGRSDSATVSAINRYISEILPLVGVFDFIPDGGGFDLSGSYEIEGITLLNTDILRFTVVCDKGSSGAVSVAHSFRSALSDRAGYYLDLSYGNAEGKSISFVLDPNCNDGEAYVSASDNGIAVRAASVYGLRTAADRLLDIICPRGSVGSLSPELTEELFVAYSEPMLELSSLCLSGILPIDAPTEITDITSAICDNSPDAVFFGALDDSDTARIQNALSEYQAISAENASDVLGLYGVSAELIYRESSGGLLCEGYRLRGNGLELALLYVSGSANAATEIELPDELDTDGLPVLAVIHTFNSEEVRVVRDGNGNFSEVCSDSFELYGDTFSYACYADMGYLAVSLSAGDNSCAYRQISVKAIS